MIEAADRQGEELGAVDVRFHFEGDRAGFEPSRVARFRRSVPLSSVLSSVGVFRGLTPVGSRLKTGADILKEVVSDGRAEFFALPVCSFVQPFLPFADSPGLSDYPSHKRAIALEYEDD